MQLGSLFGWGQEFGSHFKHKLHAQFKDEMGDQKARQSWRFPLKQAATAGSLAVLGDTIAQIRARRVRQKQIEAQDMAPCCKKKALEKCKDHDWPRALRMGTYGFLLYGPGSHAWYELLDRFLPAKSPLNLTLKVGLNQVVLGPCVILVVFAWNSLWQGQLHELPKQYQDKAMSTLVSGWKFWIPASVVNFGVLPLQTRVAFMSCCSIFWNFYLSSTMGPPA